MRDIKAFSSFLNGRRCNKCLVMDYKHELMERYKPTSVNSILAALKSFFSFCGREELKVKSLKIQKSMFSEQDRELSQGEYKRLLSAAKQKK
jgi:Site-specific recombinase XerD